MDVEARGPPLTEYTDCIVLAGVASEEAQVQLMRTPAPRNDYVHHGIIEFSATENDRVDRFWTPACRTGGRSGDHVGGTRLELGRRALFGRAIGQNSRRREREQIGKKTGAEHVGGAG